MQTEHQWKQHPLGDVFPHFDDSCLCGRNSIYFFAYKKERVTGEFFATKQAMDTYLEDKA